MGKKRPREKTKTVLKPVKQWEQLWNMQNHPSQPPWSPHHQELSYGRLWRCLGKASAKARWKRKPWPNHPSLHPPSTWYMSKVLDVWWKYQPCPPWWPNHPGLHQSSSLEAPQRTGKARSPERCGQIWARNLFDVSPQRRNKLAHGWIWPKVCAACQCQHNTD